MADDYPSRLVAVINSKDAQIEKLRRELAEAEKKFETADKLRVFWNDKARALAETSTDKARAWDALTATFEKGRRKGLTEATEIARLMAEISDNDQIAAVAAAIEAIKGGEVLE